MDPLDHERRTASDSLVPATGDSADGEAGQIRVSWLWLVGVGAATAMVAWYPSFGVIVLGAVLRAVFQGLKGPGAAASAAVCAGVVIAFAIGVSPDAAVALAPVVVTAFAVVALMWAGHATVTSISMVIALVSGASIAWDAFAAFRADTDLATVTVSYLSSIGHAVAGDGVEGTLVMAELTPWIEALWPVIYPLSAVVNAAMAAFGALLAVSRLGVRAPHIARFDAPMWAVGLLAVALLGLGAALGGMADSEVLLTGSASVLMCLRAIFVLQGYGVASVLLNRWHAGCVGHVLFLILSVWAEATFYLMGVVGLVDVWANFRGLDRGRSRVTPA